MKEEWKNGLTQEEILDVFECLFYDEIEEWFSADLCGCDNCIIELEKRWPGVHVCGSEFEKQSISLDAFYEGSILFEYFTKEEFDSYISELICPKCKNRLSPNLNIYPYEFDFEIEKYEDDIDSIYSFVQEGKDILSVDFAKTIYDTVNILSKDCQPVLIKQPLYRGRKYSSGEDYTQKDFLKYPPVNLCHSSRYSSEGEQALYLADSRETSYFEIRRPNNLVIGEFLINKPLKILDLIEPSDECLKILSYSYLSCNEQVDEEIKKKHYLFNQLFASWVKEAGFDAIKYYSTKCTEGFNYVIYNPEKIWDSVIISNVDPFHYESSWRYKKKGWTK